MGEQTKAPRGLPHPEKDVAVAAEFKAEGYYEFLGRQDLVGLLRGRDEQNASLRAAVTKLRKEVRKLNAACMRNRYADLRVAEANRISERLRNQNHNQLRELEEAGKTIAAQADNIKELTKRIDDLLSKIANGKPAARPEPVATK